jgi:hypothetical protein
VCRLQLRPPRHSPANLDWQSIHDVDQADDRRGLAIPAGARVLALTGVDVDPHVAGQKNHQGSTKLNELSEISLPSGQIVTKPMGIVL